MWRDNQVFPYNTYYNMSHPVFWILVYSLNSLKSLSESLPPSFSLSLLQYFSLFHFPISLSLPSSLFLSLTPSLAYIFLSLFHFLLPTSLFLSLILSVLICNFNFHLTHVLFIASYTYLQIFNIHTKDKIHTWYFSFVFLFAVCIYFLRNVPTYSYLNNTLESWGLFLKHLSNPHFPIFGEEGFPHQNSLTSHDNSVEF